LALAAPTAGSFVVAMALCQHSQVVENQDELGLTRRQILGETFQIEFVPSFGLLMQTGMQKSRFLYKRQLYSEIKSTLL
jgi:hypothetical protein